MFRGSFLLIFALLSLCSIAQTGAVWITDMDSISDSSQRPILLNFSGSDWCIPCQKLKQHLFSSNEFVSYTRDSVVLVNVDFPARKSKEPKANKVKKEALASRYNPKGIFPRTLLLSANGDVLRVWDGYIHTAPDDLVRELRQLINSKVSFDTQN